MNLAKVNEHIVNWLKTYKENSGVHLASSGAFWGEDDFSKFVVNGGIVQRVSGWLIFLMLSSYFLLGFFLIFP